MRKDNLKGWMDAISQISKPEYPLGYSRYQLDCIVGNAQDIQRSAIQLNMIWHNRESFKTDIDVAEAISNKVAEVKKTIEYLGTYLEPNQEDGE